jgi:hypothetical protein
VTLKEIADEWLDKTVPYPNPDLIGLQGQCVQFIRYCLNNHYKKPQWAPVLGAADFWFAYSKDSSINKFWERILNTPEFIPREGDICIWNHNKGGGYGHIGIVYGPEQNTRIMTCLEQNWKPLKVTIVTHNYNDVFGFFRIKEQA